MAQFRFVQFLALVLLSLQPLASSAMIFDSGIPEDQKRSLEADLKYLHQLGIVSAPASVTDLLQIKGSTDSSTLRQWLDERVRIVVSEDWNRNTSVHVSRTRLRYPNPDLLPIFDPAPPRPKDDDNPKKPLVVMSNLGASIYIRGKMSNQALTVSLQSGYQELVRSPRVGVIQIGEGLFHRRLRIQPEAQDAPANSISRLSTLFHEARHSDGNGVSLGYIHAVCPKGHALEDRYACDRNRNGPYTVGGQVMKLLLSSCTDCSESELEKLRLKSLEAFSRVLPEHRVPGMSALQKTVDVDPAPEFAL